jgi:hypothetical protein
MWVCSLAVGVTCFHQGFNKGVPDSGVGYEVEEDNIRGMADASYFSTGISRILLTVPAYGYISLQTQCTHLQLLKRTLLTFIRKNGEWFVLDY